MRGERLSVSGRPALSLMASSEPQRPLCNSLSAALSAPAPQVVIFGVYSLSFPPVSSDESSGNQAWLLPGDESPAVVQEALETRRRSPWLHPSHCPGSGPGAGTAHTLMWEMRFVLPITRREKARARVEESKGHCAPSCVISVHLFAVSESPHPRL